MKDKNKKISFFTRIKNHFDNHRDEYIKNTSYKMFLYKIEDTLNAIFFLLLTFVYVFFVYSCYKYSIFKNKEKYNNNILTSASAKSINEISNYDTLTDLTGTSWEFDNSLVFIDSGYFSVTFISNNSYYSSFVYSYSSSEPEIIRYLLFVDENHHQSLAYEYTTGWVNQAYRTINITGGTDATNTDLIEWLQANATQVITGYSSTINLTNCTCNRTSETGLNGSYIATITANTGYYLTNVSTTLGTITYSNNNKVATISISDVTEDFTISAVASLIYHNISYNLGNVVITSNKPTQIDEISSISITFQPFSNYVLPQYINVEGVTEYIWNDETGVLTLVNSYDNVEITINAEYKSGQYTFVELIDSVTLVPVNTFFNLFNFQLLGVNIYNLLLSALILFVIIKIILKVFK